MQEVEGIIDYGEWYVVEQQDSQTVYDLSGNLVADKVRVLRKVNGFLLLEGPIGEIHLLHRSGKTILPPFEKDDVNVEETVF